MRWAAAHVGFRGGTVVSTAAGCIAAFAAARSFVAWAIWLLAALVVRAEVLRIATYNVENYGPADRVTELGFRKDYPKPESEKRALRTVIRAINVDVLVLQEMGGPAHLEELRHDLRVEGVDYPYAAIALASDPDRHLALLSRRPLVEVRTHADLGFTYFGIRQRVKRGMLEATIATAAGGLTIFAVHLKSRFTERPDDPLSAIRRLEEATTVRDAVLARFPQPRTARFVLLGDFNDSRTSRPLQRLQVRGKTEIAALLPASDSRGETWTYYYRREDAYSGVDHVLVSPALTTWTEGGGARIFDGPGTLVASDHRPVILTLLLNAKN